MIKILLVDDEILAIEYLKSLVEWEQYGYQIVGQAMNGYQALEIFKEERPDIIISDIKMPGMDGLELTKNLKQSNTRVKIILVSAYKDFEYAQKGFEYGVQNYLLKHELCEEKILQELDKVSQILEEEKVKEKITKQHFAKQLIQDDGNKINIQNIGNRFFLMMINKRDIFLDGKWLEMDWEAREKADMREILELSDENIFYLTELELTSRTFVVLYGIDGIHSKGLIEEKIRKKAESVVLWLNHHTITTFNVLYSKEITKKEIATTFRNMSKWIRNMIFYTKNNSISVEELLLYQDQIKISWHEWETDIKQALYDENQKVEDKIQFVFEWFRMQLGTKGLLRELCYFLEKLKQEIEEKEVIVCYENTSINHTIFDIEAYYKRCFGYLQEQIMQKENENYSKQIQEILHYIRKNYSQEISLESLGEAFHMNGVYLGQIFKQEVGMTFLKYLTNYRVKIAKELLTKENLNISEVSIRVGYKTSQYFSRIFLKAEGIKPQEYKNGTKGKKKKKTEK